MGEPGGGEALVMILGGALQGAGHLLHRELGGDDDPPLGARHEEAPGAHEVRVSVQLAAGVLT